MDLHSFGRFARKYLGDIKPKKRDWVDDDGLVYSAHDDQGREVLDDTPREPPDDHVHQPSLAEQIRAMIQSERLAQAAREEGFETFEESEDFDIDDDGHIPSPHENEYDPSFRDIRADVEEERNTRSRSKAPKNNLSGDQPEPGIPADRAQPESGEA